MVYHMLFHQNLYQKRKYLHLLKWLIVFLQSEVKSEKPKAPLKAELGHLAHTYYSWYRPSETTIRKHNILKKNLGKTQTLLFADQIRESVVILDRTFYISSMKKLLNDENKFKKLSTDPTHLREGQLQRYLCQLNKSTNFLDKKTYHEIYPSGSQYARCMVSLSYIKFKIHVSFHLLDQ